MIASVTSSKCPECAGGILDVGDELVCRGCGLAFGKEIIEAKSARAMQAIDFTGQALGGYLGPPDAGVESFTAGFAASPSTYKYLKLVSDYSGREDSTVYSCAKLIERVAEKLSMPRLVVGQAVTIAKTLLGDKLIRSDVPTPAVSAYSIATACKILGVSSVSLREIVESHRLLGRRVKISSLIRLSLESPFKAGPRRAEDYVGRIIGRLASLPGPLRSLVREKMDQSAYFPALRGASLEALAAVGEEGRGGHSPCSLAATAVYAAEANLARTGLRKRVLTQREIAKSGGVAEYTVRELYGCLFRRFPQGMPFGVKPTRAQPPPL